MNCRIFLTKKKSTDRDDFLRVQYIYRVTRMLYNVLIFLIYHFLRKLRL